MPFMPAQPVGQPVVEKPLCAPAAKQRDTIERGTWLDRVIEAMTGKRHHVARLYAATSRRQKLPAIKRLATDIIGNPQRLYHRRKGCHVESRQQHKAHFAAAWPCHGLLCLFAHSVPFRPHSVSLLSFYEKIFVLAKYLQPNRFTA